MKFDWDSEQITDTKKLFIKPSVFISSLKVFQIADNIDWVPQSHYNNCDSRDIKAGAIIFWLNIVVLIHFRVLLAIWKQAIKNMLYIYRR